MADLEHFLSKVMPVAWFKFEWKRFHARVAGWAWTSGGSSLRRMCSSMDVGFSRRASMESGCQFFVGKRGGHGHGGGGHCDQLAIIEMQKDVALDQSACPVGNDKRGAPVNEALQSFKNRGFGIDVHCAGGLVQN